MKLIYLLIILLFLTACTTQTDKLGTCLEDKATKICNDKNSLFDSLTQSNKEFKCLSDDRQTLTEYKFTAKEINSCGQ